MAEIGIFWVYKNTVLGRACDISQGHENIPGLIDSPDNHIDVWENDNNWINPFPELIGSEYQTVPRGRVIYSTKYKKAIIYMDRKLHTKVIKKLIIEFFQLETIPIGWSIDEHYTTETQALNAIFDDDYL